MSNIDDEAHPHSMGSFKVKVAEGHEAEGGEQFLAMMEEACLNGATPNQVLSDITTGIGHFFMRYSKDPVESADLVGKSLVHFVTLLMGEKFQGVPRDTMQ